MFNLKISLEMEIKMEIGSHGNVLYSKIYWDAARGSSSARRFRMMDRSAGAKEQREETKLAINAKDC